MTKIDAEFSMKRDLFGTWSSLGGPKRLRALRTAHGLTLDDLATKIGVSKSALSKLENARQRPNPSLDMIQAIADALWIEREELLDSESSEQREQPRQLSQAALALKLYLRQLNTSRGNVRRFHHVSTHPEPPKTVQDWRRFTEWLALFTGRDPRPIAPHAKQTARIRSFKRA